MLHASAIADNRRVIIIAGNKGSGKTTLALRGALVHGMRYLSNDHLIIYPGEAPDVALHSRLVLTSLPTPIPVKVGTYLDLEQILPEPWDTEGTDLARYRAMPRRDRYQHDVRVVYTYRRLGQDNPVMMPLGASHAGLLVLVVLARYAAADGPPGDPVPVADPVTALMEHVRFDWMFDPVLNYQYVPRRDRDRAAYAADAQRLAEALAGSRRCHLLGSCRRSRAAAGPARRPAVSAPLVSVIIATRNRPRLLRLALASIAAQERLSGGAVPVRPHRQRRCGPEPVRHAGPAFVAAVACPRCPRRPVPGLSRRHVLARVQPAGRRGERRGRCRRLVHASGRYVAGRLDSAATRRAALNGRGAGRCGYEAA
jgi:hypothetical protein